MEVRFTTDGKSKIDRILEGGTGPVSLTHFSLGTSRFSTRPIPSAINTSDLSWESGSPRSLREVLETTGTDADEISMTLFLPHGYAYSGPIGVVGLVDADGDVIAAALLESVFTKDQTSGTVAARNYGNAVSFTILLRYSGIGSTVALPPLSRAGSLSSVASFSDLGNSTPGNAVLVNEPVPRLALKTSAGDWKLEDDGYIDNGNIFEESVVSGQAVYFDTRNTPRRFKSDFGTVAHIQVTDGGSGYTDGNNLDIVTISAPPNPGTQATATATVSGGAITAITVTSGGSGYTSAPTVGFTGGGGSGATATAFFPPPIGARGVPKSIFVGAGSKLKPLTRATATAVLGTGTNADEVVDVTVVYGGSGYTTSSPPTVTITGGGGSGARATATIVNGEVTGFTNIVGGSGYTSPLTAIIEDPPAPYTLGSKYYTDVHGNLVTAGDASTEVGIALSDKELFVTAGLYNTGIRG